MARLFRYAMTGALLALGLIGPVVQAQPPTLHGARFPAPNGRVEVVVVNEFFTGQMWLVPAAGSPRLVVQSPGEVISRVAWQADSQAFTFVRTPLGTQTAGLGQVWRLNLADSQPVPVTPAESPRPAPAPPVVSTGRTAQLPPTEIRVLHRAENTCRDVPPGQIDTIPFEEYVKRVVPHEVYAGSWPMDTLRAQAVAARTYAWYHVALNPQAEWHVTDWVDYQYMCDTTHPRTDQAVDETRSEYLAFDGQVILAMYSAENGSPTRTYPNVPYLQAVDDPVSFGFERYGHGYGMGQWGAQRWADQHGWSYTAILRHYYTNVTLQRGLSALEAGSAVSIVAPWAGFYHTGNVLRVALNLTGATSPISRTRIIITGPPTATHVVTITGAITQTAIDLSAWPDSHLLSRTLTLTAETVTTGGARRVSEPVQIGLDRSSPTGALVWPVAGTGSGSTFWGAPMVSADDETSGVRQMAIGQQGWRWEGETMTPHNPALPGQVVADAAALNGRALALPVGPGQAAEWQTVVTTLPAGTAYRAYFRLRAADNRQMAEAARLSVTDGSGELVGLHRLRGTDFRAAGAYQEFHVDFVNPDTGSGSIGLPLMFGLASTGAAALTLDRFVVLGWPMPYQPNLPPLSGADFRVKVIDGAGNVSADLPVITLNRHTYLPLVLKGG